MAPRVCRASSAPPRIECAQAIDRGLTEGNALRILLVSDSYPPFIGGANRGIQQLAVELAQRDHAVGVATSWQAGLPAYEEHDGVAVYRLRDLTSRVPWISADPYVHTPPPFPDPEATWRFHRLLKRFRPEIVHAYGWLSYSCAAAMRGKDVPFVLSARDYANVCAVRTLLRHDHICDGPALAKCLECAGSFYGKPKGVIAVLGVLAGRSLLRRRMTGLHSCSRYVQGVMRQYLLETEERTDNGHSDNFADTVIPDFRGTPDELAAPQSSYLAQLPDTPFILYVGALRLVKGLEPLLAAYRRLVEPPPLVLMGHRAPDTPQMLPSGVTVVHDVPYATVFAAWDRALFGVAPSIWPEPLGNVVHEAMSRGKPVVGTIPGGHRDMISDGETGLLVRAGDADGLAAAMRLLIDNPAVRERMGAAARLRAQDFTASAVMPAFEQLYAKSLAAR